MSRRHELLTTHQEVIRVMETLNLSSSEVAVLMGVNRPTIDEWLLQSTKDCFNLDFATA